MKQIFINNKATTMFINADVSTSKFIKYVRERMIEPDNIYGLERPNDCKAIVIKGTYYDAIKIFTDNEVTILEFEDVVPIKTNNYGNN